MKLFNYVFLSWKYWLLIFPIYSAILIIWQKWDQKGLPGFSYYKRCHFNNAEVFFFIIENICFCFYKISWDMSICFSLLMTPSTKLSFLDLRKFTILHCLPYPGTLLNTASFHHIHYVELCPLFFNCCVFLFGHHHYPKPETTKAGWLTCSSVSVH